MTPSKEPFQTTDLNLASFLVHEGLEAEKFKKGEARSGYPIGGWCFRDDTKRVQCLVIQYNEDKSQVNPKTFHQTLTKVRGQMYDYLGIKKKR